MFDLSEFIVWSAVATGPRRCNMDWRLLDGPSLFIESSLVDSFSKLANQATIRQADFDMSYEMADEYLYL